MTDSEVDVARLLKEYVSKPPPTSLTREEKESLRQFVTKNRDFRKLKDIIAMMAWQGQVYALNEDPAAEDFRIRFAKAQGRREGMLQALALLESLVEKEDEDGG